ncbi:MAG: hypothetical protein M0D55_02755 [Elusimicrobiota bacterium]|nr:MAG: hypothetical protein M0D55_02755 [Elusimicrobiota bacterium]
MSKKKAGKKSVDIGALRMPEGLSPGKAYMAFWCLQDDRLGLHKDEFASVVKRALIDPKFKVRLQTDTAAVLKESGISLGQLKIKVVDNNDGVIHLMIPRLRAVAKAGCFAELEDGDLKSRADKAHCFDDFNTGNWGSYGSNMTDKGDSHTADK